MVIERHGKRTRGTANGDGGLYGNVARQRTAWGNGVDGGLERWRMEVCMLNAFLNEIRTNFPSGSNLGTCQ